MLRNWAVGRGSGRRSVGLRGVRRWFVGIVACLSFVEMQHSSRSAECSRCFGSAVPGSLALCQLSAFRNMRSRSANLQEKPRPYGLACGFVKLLAYCGLSEGYEVCSEKDEARFGAW